jgi:hypothetical protein
MRVTYSSNRKSSSDNLPRRHFDKFDIEAEKEGLAIRSANSFRIHRQSKRGGGAIPLAKAA